MVPFASLFERRDSLENPSVNLYQALMGEMMTSTTAGVSLSDEKAAAVPDVFACIQVLSQDLAAAPVKLRQSNTDGSHSDSESHGLWEILRELANPETTAYEFRYTMQRNLLTYSKAYAEIVRRNFDGDVLAVWALDPRYMKVDRDGLNRKRYTYTLPGGTPQVWIFDANKPPIFELTHESPIRKCRDLIGLAHALELFASKFFANAARTSGVLTVPPGFSDNARKNLRESFGAIYQGAINAHKVPILEAGATFTPVSNTNDEAQFIETRKYVRTQIAGVFRVPPHKMGDNERSTFSNIEHQSIDYVYGALDPFFKSWEQAIKRDFLSTKQFRRFRVVFDRESLTRGDMKSQYDALAVGRQNGWMSANDILRKLDENPVDAASGGDRYLVNGNMVPVDKAGDKPSAPVAAVPDGGAA